MRKEDDESYIALFLATVRDVRGRLEFEGDQHARFNRDNRNSRWAHSPRAHAKVYIAATVLTMLTACDAIVKDSRSPAEAKERLQMAQCVIANVEDAYALKELAERVKNRDGEAVQELADRVIAIFGCVERGTRANGPN